MLDKSISSALKVWIKQGDRMVCGIIGPGTSRTLSAKWDSPLEQTNVGTQGAIEKTGGLVQGLTGATSVTTFSSTQIWQGNMPHKFSVNLVLFAQYDAAEEVMKPLQWLEEFASPDLKGVVPVDWKAIAGYLGLKESSGSAFGRIPQPVTINVGRRVIVPMCVIENITTPLDKEVTRDGDLIRAEVQLDIQTMVMQNKDKIPGTWLGGKPGGNQTIYID